MAKKIIAVILAVLMIAAVLAACGNSTPAPSGGDKPAPAPAPAPAPSGDKDKEEEKQEEEAKPEYTQTYTIKYSSYAPEGHPTNIALEIPLKEFIEEKSNGRIKVEIYSAGSLTTQASTLDGIINGVTDMGYDSPAYYAGVYPRVELFTTPGLMYGDYQQQYDLFNEFNETWPSQVYEDNIYNMMWQPVPVSLFVSQKPMTSWDDIQGYSCRVPGDKVPYFQAIGCAPVVMSTADIYEAIRLNVIEGSCVSIIAVQTTSIDELCDYATRWWGGTGMTGTHFSKELYESMDPEAQAVIDAARDLCRERLWREDLDYQESTANENVFKRNPNFQYLDFDDDCVAKMAEAAIPVLEAKAAEVDALGLDGSGLYEWMKAHAVG